MSILEKIDSFLEEGIRPDKTQWTIEFLDTKEKGKIKSQYEKITGYKAPSIKKGAVLTFDSDTSADEFYEWTRKLNTGGSLEYK